MFCTQIAVFSEYIFPYNNEEFCHPSPPSGRGTAIMFFRLFLIHIDWPSSIALLMFFLFLAKGGVFLTQTEDEFSGYAFAWEEVRVQYPLLV